MKRDELLKQAADVGLDVDGRWSDERLQNEISKKKAGDPRHDQTEGGKNAPEIVAQPTQVKTGNTPIRLLYDTWFVDDIRTPAGKVVEVDVDTAKRMIAHGKAERADPLPGENAA